jgi:transcriptional regulator with XRE-family HTH domain
MNKPKKPNKKLQRERELYGWSQARIAEKLGTTVKRVSMWECGDATPDRYYQEKLCDLFGKNAEELGLLSQASGDDDDPQENSTTQRDNSKNASSLPQPLQFLVPSGTHVNVTIQVHQQSPPSSLDEIGTGVWVDAQPHPAAYSSHEDIPTRVGHEAVDRRDFLRETGRVAAAGAAFLAFHDMLGAELLGRFNRALKKPATIDARMLTYLERRTEAYWQDRHSAALTSSDLLSYALEHVQRIIVLLEGSLTPSIRTHLCCIASGATQLVGHLLFDLGEFAQARNFHQLAINAAQEGGNQALEAVAWGRMSFTWTYSNNALEALHCIQEARRLASKSTNITVRSYLAAVEAEIHAIQSSAKACLKALDDAANVEDQYHQQDGMYWLHFDRSRLSGYQGICFKRLYSPEDARTHTFIHQAQQVLTDALAKLDPAKIQRRPTLLIDIAGTYMQQGNVGSACENATQALSIMAQTKSHAASQRLLALRQQLNPWKDTLDVKNLDEQISVLITPTWDRGIA